MMKRKVRLHIPKYPHGGPHEEQDQPISTGMDFDESKRTAEQADQAARDFNIRYVQSENYKKLLRKQGYSPDEIKARQDAILNLQPSLYVKEGNSMVSEGENGNAQVRYNVTDMGDWPSWQNIAAHEMGHVGVDSGRSPLKRGERRLLRKIRKNNVSSDSEHAEHDLEPQENRADLTELRQRLFETGTFDSTKEQRFTKEDLQNYKNLMKENPEDSTIWNRMFRLYEDKDIIKIMNSVASTGENNQELTQAKYGGIFQYHRGGAVHNKSPHPHSKFITSDADVYRYRKEMYNDSLRYNKAYLKQNELMGDFLADPSENIDWSIARLKAERVKEQNIPDRYKIGWDSQEKMFANGFKPTIAREEDNELINYYKKLGFGDNDIAYHASPDLHSDKIKPIGTYFDGYADSPIYQAPTQEVVFDPSFEPKPKGTLDPKESINVNLMKSGYATDTKSANAFKKKLWEDVNPDIPYKTRNNAAQNTKLNSWIFDNEDKLAEFGKTGSTKIQDSFSNIDFTNAQEPDEIYGEHSFRTGNHIVNGVLTSNVPETPSLQTEPVRKPERDQSDAYRRALNRSGVELPEINPRTNISTTPVSTNGVDFTKPDNTTENAKKDHKFKDWNPTKSPFRMEVAPLPKVTPRPLRKSMYSEGGEVMNLTDLEIAEYEKGGYTVEEFHKGGAVHNKSPHPHKKNSVNHVSFDREAIERKLDNNIAKGTIPMYVDQQGESRVHPRQGVYTQGRKKGSDLSGVYKQPVDYTQIWEDQEDGVKDLFLPPVTVNASAKKWIPKGGLSRTESAGITELINGYQNDEGIHDAIDEKKFSSNGELTREQAYKLIKKDPSLYKKAINKQRSGTPQVKGITKEQSEKNRPTGINTSIYMLDDAYNGIIDPMVQAGKSLFTDPGQLGYIPDAMKAYGQQYMPEIFGKPNYFDVNFYDNAKKGYSAAENVLTVLPADIGKSLLLKKVIKRSGKKLKALKQTPKKRLADKVDQKLLDEAARFEEFKVIAGKAIEDHNRRILAYERSISKPLSAEQTPRLLSKEEVIKRNSQEMYDFYEERAKGTKVGDDYRSFRGNPKLGPNKFDDGGEYGGTQQAGKRKVRISLPKARYGGLFH